MTAPSHQVLSQETMLDFLSHLRRTGNISLSAQAVGVSRQQVREWYNRSLRDRKDARYLIRDPLGGDPDVAFCDAWNRAKDDSLDLVRDNAFDMAAGLKVKPIIHQGKLAYEPDHEAEFKYDVMSGLPVYPPKLDADGKPIPLTVPEVFPSLTMDYLKLRDPDFKPKTEVDLTTQGKPIAVPERVVDMATFLLEFGRKPGQ